MAALRRSSSAAKNQSVTDMRGPKTLRSGLVSSSVGCAPVAFNDLEACELLGRGAYGAVHRMFEKRTGECRVMKTVVRPEGWDDKRLKMEAEILQNLDHPHILRIFSWYEEGDSVNIVMEHCDGGELLNTVRAGRRRGESLPEPWIAVAVKQCFEALVYIHSKGVVHKDLKSQNILLLHRTENEHGSMFGLMPHVVICDLGIAEICQRGFYMRGHIIAGTPATMAPEVWKGNCCPKSDVWSMGCVMFELFTNRLPFRVIGDLRKAAAQQASWLALHRKGPDWNVLQTGDDAKHLCQLLLTFKEKARPTAMECLKHPWFTLTANELTPDEIRSLCTSVSRWRERSPMQRALCLKMAVGCTCISRFGRLFSTFDTDCSGVLEPAEVVTALTGLGIDKVTAKKTAQALDINNDNSCEYLEFVAACLVSLEEQYDELLRQEFRSLDIGSKGDLNRAEMNKLMDELMPFANSHGLKLEDLDENNDGSISFSEFCSYFGRPGVTYRDEWNREAPSGSIPMKEHIRIVGSTDTYEQSMEQIMKSMELSLDKIKTLDKLSGIIGSNADLKGKKDKDDGKNAAAASGQKAGVASSKPASKSPSKSPSASSRRKASKDGASSKGSCSGKDSKKSAADQCTPRTTSTAPARSMSTTPSTSPRGRSDKKHEDSNFSSHRSSNKSDPEGPSKDAEERSSAHESQCSDPQGSPDEPDKEAADSPHVVTTSFVHSSVASFEQTKAAACTGCWLTGSEGCCVQPVQRKWNLGNVPCRVSL